jgi:thiamine-monophosphate kinase
VVLGIGDDAALLRQGSGELLAVTMDTLVEGVHFPAGTDSRDLGFKIVAVNLSDLAAMGAQPAWATLALTLPAVDSAWLQGFAGGMQCLARRHGLSLVGGDTTRGPLSITMQAAGRVNGEQVLRRDAARSGDRILVTGTLGDAALGLRLLQGRAQVDDAAHRRYLLKRFLRPSPRVAAGRLAAGKASSAIDISDGFVQDLGHMLKASGVGARVFLDRLPRSAALLANVPASQALSLALSGGEDYELCLSCPAADSPRLCAALRRDGCMVTEVGEITGEPQLRLLDGAGRCQPAPPGWDHFAARGGCNGRESE